MREETQEKGMARWIDGLRQYQTLGLYLVMNGVDLTEQINRAIAFNRNGEVGNYKYKWEWVLTTECYIETKPK